MPLNFPSSPVDGQQYDQWVYSSAKGAWLAKPLEPMAAVPSPVAPAFPQPGDMWFNTNEATTYVYYDDGNSSQWVEMVAQTGLPQPLAIAQGGTGATTVAGAQDSLRVGLVNIVPTSVSVASGSGSFNSTSGLVTFTGATEIRLNGVFTADFKSYRIVVNIDTSSATTSILYRTKTDSSIITADYDFGGARWQVNQGSPYAYNLATATGWESGNIDTEANKAHLASIDIAYPFQTPKRTMVTLHSVGTISGNGTNTYIVGGMLHNNASMTGFVIATTSGTAQLGGTVQVYGYN